MITVMLAAPAVRGQPAHSRSTDTRLVVLDATVVDNNGRFVTNPLRQAFTVLENGVEQQIKTFRREDVLVSMGLVVDNSGSMRDKRAKVEAAALALVKDSNPEDEVFVVNFNDDNLRGHVQPALMPEAEQRCGMLCARQSIMSGGMRETRRRFW